MSTPPAVLVVEDDVSTQGLLAAVVKHLGLRALIAGDGRGAMAIIAEETPAAIILDLIMPVMDGFEVLREMKRKTPDLLAKTIVITAASIRNVGEVPEMRSVAKFLRKPLDIDQLCNCVLGCIGDASKKAGRGGAYETPPRP
jgi:CheY-like chemotaxis protein